MDVVHPPFMGPVEQYLWKEAVDVVVVLLLNPQLQAEVLGLLSDLVLTALVKGTNGPGRDSSLCLIFSPHP